MYTLSSMLCRWLGGVVVSVSDLWSHCRATTLGKLFTSMCLCSPSSTIWYLARAFMSTHLYVAANGMGPLDKGSIVVAVLQWSDCLEPRYKWSTLLYFFYIYRCRWFVSAVTGWLRQQTSVLSASSLSPAFSCSCSVLLVQLSQCLRLITSSWLSTTMASVCILTMFIFLVFS